MPNTAFVAQIDSIIESSQHPGGRLYRRGHWGSWGTVTQLRLCWDQVDSSPWSPIAEPGSHSSSPLARWVPPVPPRVWQCLYAPMECKVQSQPSRAQSLLLPLSPGAGSDIPECSAALISPCYIVIMVVLISQDCCEDSTIYPARRNHKVNFVSYSTLDPRVKIP